MIDSSDGWFTATHWKEFLTIHLKYNHKAA